MSSPYTTTVKKKKNGQKLYQEDDAFERSPFRSKHVQRTIMTAISLLIGIAIAYLRAMNSVALVDGELKNERPSSVSTLPNPSDATVKTNNEMMMVPRFRFARPSDCPDVLWDSAEKARKTLLEIEGQQVLDNPSMNGSSHKHHEQFAVIMISLGSASNHTNVERAIQSMRRRGLYHGRVVVITDDGDRYSNVVQSDPFQQVTLLVIDPSEIHKHLKQTMPYKRFKTQVLDLMDTDPALDNYEYVAYIDVDIILGDDLHDFIGYATQKMHRVIEQLSVKSFQDAFSEDSLTQSTAQAPRLETNRTLSKSFMLMFLEQGGGKEREKHRLNEVWHGAVMMLHRTYSRKCLDLWRSMFDSNKYDRDQTALYRMYHHRPEMRAQCEIYAMDHDVFLLMPTDETMKQGWSAVFVHNTNTGRARTIDKRVQFDYYRCAMMLDESVMKEDIAKKKRKPSIRKEEAKAGLVWDGLDLVEDSSPSS